MTAADTSSGPTELRTTVCPGCGAVLVATADADGRHPGASAGCWHLFQVTVGGLRDEAAQDAQTAALLQLARDTYDAQHHLPGEPAAAALRLYLERDRGQGPLAAAALAARVDDAALRSLQRPARWTTTVADLAADLDVVDLPALVGAWADATWADWAPAAAELRRAADSAPTG
ncbi:hypothetical protein GCU67_19965 [Modestobacter muralis]|uniref:Uncharacterized protein n=1 Tax=Modestobacter muralis TaxID=1608614 RepID=A0A6P0F2V0_9ACTN|nr:hypothetical protein [Modestobacter muralis]NEN53324.1 hypothetical protein [Modestobacter muralis]